MYTGLTGKYMNLQLRIVIRSGSRVPSRPRVIREDNSGISNPKVKRLAGHRAEKQILTGFEF